jgi:hypothetical protein
MAEMFMAFFQNNRMLGKLTTDMYIRIPMVCLISAMSTLAIFLFT